MPRSARGIALHVLVRVVRYCAWADLALHAALVDSTLERRDRAFATELVYGGLRMRGRLEAELQQVLDRALGLFAHDEQSIFQLPKLSLVVLTCVFAATHASQTSLFCNLQSLVQPAA